MFFGLLDRTDVHEGVFWQVIPLAVAKFLEAADRVFERRDLTRLAGEDFGDQKRLRQEAFDAAGTVDDQLIFFRQFVDTENRDDILQFAVTLSESSARGGHS